MRTAAWRGRAIGWAAVALCSCRAPATAPDPSPAGLLRVGHESDVLTLDPAASTEDATFSILSNIYEGLVTFDEDMTLVPSLAVTWSSVDELTWLVDLRRDVRFHDGTPLTASVVRQALARAGERADSDVRAYLEPLSAVEVEGDHRLRLRTRRREALLMSRLAYVLIAHQADGEAGMTGTGPYRLVRWEKGRFLEAEAFAGYWGGRPPVERVRFVPVGSGDATVTALRSGAVDVVRDFPETLGLASIRGVRTVAHPGLTTTYLWMNATPRASAAGTANPFADRRVRHALSHAVDRAGLVHRLGGHGRSVHHLVPQTIAGHVPALEVPPFDPVAARRLLAEAGYPAGFTAELGFRSDAQPVRALAEGVRDMLAAASVRVTLRPLDQATLIREWREQSLPFFIAGWRFETADAHAFMRDCLTTRDAARARGGYNAGFSDPALDALIDAHAEVFGEQARQRRYEDLMRSATRALPVIPLLDRAALYGVSERVAFSPRLDGRLLAAEMSLR